MKVDPAVLDRYAGRYELAPTFVVTVDARGRASVRTGDRPAELRNLRRGRSDFFFKVVDAQITFVVDANGRATSLVLHQNGANVPGKRIE